MLLNIRTIIVQHSTTRVLLYWRQHVLKSIDLAFDMHKGKEYLQDKNRSDFVPYCFAWNFNKILAFLSFTFIISNRITQSNSSSWSYFNHSWARTCFQTASFWLPLFWNDTQSLSNPGAQCWPQKETVGRCGQDPISGKGV